ncbi:Cupredoxin [Phellopilus nigrolimitatus]|nr:Cupredoxin [Phellopilus nigrolimitatus]
MFYSTVLSFGLLLAPFVSAAVHDVTVGSSAGALTYSPDAIFASAGDQVVFHFQQKNHTATQSSFADPCGLKAGGFDSGFMPVAANVTDNFPTYTITVNDTNPIWVYCRQAANTAASHCGNGMVFAVNCGADGTTNSFTNFKNAALAIGASLQANASSTAAAGGSGTVSAASQTSTEASTPVSSTASSAAAATHTVVVGGNSSLTFSPAEVSAQPNDVVVFQFQSKNHTITQSSFAAPCEQLAATSSSAAGFDSGFLPVAAGSSEFPTFSITVNNTTPVWAYCRQTGHCGLGMVMAINAVDSSAKNFTAFKASAMQINGTSSNSTGSGSSSSNTTTSGAPRTIGVAGMSLGMAGAAFLLSL